VKLRIAALAFMAAAAIAPQSVFAADEDDPLFVKGRSLFGRCRACHAFKPDTRSLSRGPNLWDVVGRKAGTAAGYTEYSRAMLDSKVIWSAETIDSYLADPKGYIPGNLMNFIGVPKPDERKALVNYLVKVTGTAARPEQVTGLKLIRVEDRD
jgi:cytochrome c2